MALENLLLFSSNGSEVRRGYKMLWFERDRVPEGVWPFLRVVYANLQTLEEDYLVSSIDLTDGLESQTISGWINAYRQVILRRVIDLAQACIVSWNAGQCLGAIVCARALLETLAIFHSFLGRSQQSANDKDWEKVGRLVSAYAFSTSSGPQKKIRTPEHPPRVQQAVIDFTRATQLGAEQFWEQICNFSHPNGAPMISRFGIIRDSRMDLRPHTDMEGEEFIAIYNCLYSICWLFNSMADVELLLDHVRYGEAPSDDHPLIKEKRLTDEVVAAVASTMKKVRIGPSKRKALKY